MSICFTILFSHSMKAQSHVLVYESRYHRHLIRRWYLLNMKDSLLTVIHVVELITRRVSPEQTVEGHHGHPRGSRTPSYTFQHLRVGLKTKSCEALLYRWHLRYSDRRRRVPSIDNFRNVPPQAA